MCECVPDPFIPTKSLYTCLVRIYLKPIKLYLRIFSRSVTRSLTWHFIAGAWAKVGRYHSYLLLCSYFIPRIRFFIKFPFIYSPVVYLHVNMKGVIKGEYACWRIIKLYDEETRRLRFGGDINILYQTKTFV